jgi:hypothetical protein
MPTLTVFPDAGSPGTTSGDTRVTRSGVDETWAALVGGAGTSAAPTNVTGEFVQFAASATLNQWAAMRRSLFHFDTSALGAGASIVSATLSLFGAGSSDGLGVSPNINIYQSTVVSDNAFVASDFSQVGSTAFSTAIPFASWSNTAYNDFVLNANGLANINKTGVSKFATRNANFEVAGSAPTWSSLGSSSITGHYADETGTANDPMLVITYTLPSQLLSLLGIG